ncbi:hypothetical protein FIU97_05185 [Roseivivax sp. THAF40]|nr:hypothetical protein FIV09_04925 [Roseivivax sp. THAF197b]QFT45966.1 hypothetical protein FIU97_05185 [Roseivivax sp. THAF40]
MPTWLRRATCGLTPLGCPIDLHLSLHPIRVNGRGPVQGPNLACFRASAKEGRRLARSSPGKWRRRGLGPVRPEDPFWQVIGPAEARRRTASRRTEGRSAKEKGVRRSERLSLTAHRRPRTYVMSHPVGSCVRLPVAHGPVTASPGSIPILSGVAATVRQFDCSSTVAQDYPHHIAFSECMLNAEGLRAYPKG